MEYPQSRLIFMTHMNKRTLLNNKLDLDDFYVNWLIWNMTQSQKKMATIFGKIF